MRKLFKLLVFVIPISVMFASCYPAFDATIEEMDIAMTKFDSTQNFDELSTFFLYDTIIYITDEDNPEDIDRTQEDHILAEVRQNLLDIGWTEVPKPAPGSEIDADVSIMISALATDISYYYYYWWDYWYWYPWSYWYPWYPGYPGYPGYPWYPSYPSYSYTVGTVIIDMINMDEVEEPASNEENPSIKFPMVWTGAINGILSGSDENIAKRLTTQIDQVFGQSTYLIKKAPSNE